MREVGDTQDDVQCFLKQAATAGSPHSGATLIIDGKLTLSKPLIVPGGVTLAGTGGRGEGFLVMDPQAPFTGSFIRVPGNTENVTIRNLRIEGPGSTMKLDGIQIFPSARRIYVEDVLIANCRIAIFGGKNTQMIYVNKSLAFDCETNIRINPGSKHWRIRDSDLRQSQRRLISIAGPDVHDILIDGCILENYGLDTQRPDSQRAAIAVEQGSSGVFVFSNRFEAGDAAHPGFPQPPALFVVDPATSGVRFLCNMLRNDCFVVPPPQPHPSPMGVHYGFNMHQDPTNAINQLHGFGV